MRHPDSIASAGTGRSSVLAPPPLSADSHWGALHGCAAALALAGAIRRTGGCSLVVAPDAREAERFAAELTFFSRWTDGEAEPDILLFPDWETLPYDVFSPHPESVSTRLATLYRLPRVQTGAVVVTVGALMQRLAPRSYVEGRTLLIQVGQRFELDAARRRLGEAGYASVAQVTGHGEFAVRGALIDIFPMGSTHPFRIDLFDDEVESIRRFDPDTQLSAQRLERVQLLPAREFPMTPEAITLFRRQYRRRFEGDPKRSRVYREVSEGIAGGGLEFYLPLFFERADTLFDFLPPGARLVELDTLDALSRQSWREIRARYDQLGHDVERPLLSPEEVYVPPEELAATAGSLPRVSIQPFEIAPGSKSGGTVINFATEVPPRLPIDAHAETPTAALTEFVEKLDGRTLVAAESPGRREHLRAVLQGAGLHAETLSGWAEFLTATAPLALVVAPLERGLLARDSGLAVVVEEQLLGERARARPRRRSERDPEAIIRDLTDLREGAPVVHEEYGVGRYRGLQTLSAGSVTGEFLTVEYAGGDLLYVPVHALDLITRYTGASPEGAPLHRLGSEQWRRARARAAKQIRDVAAELLDIYARRQARKGHAFALQERDFRVFESEFPFEETPDQHQAIEAVIADMRAGSPMDRIVCGDVGFGKTEVAMRAAYVAAEAGKQCAVLVPTTLLAQQHYQTFSDRFADWPVCIEVLSRFRSGKEADRILAGLASGAIDIVIGTHKLLQPSVRFKNLGIVVIDEEHRFGVRHKERLKALRAEVDVLTLTATPIPRTLNMAMGGLRELSLITTPPEERLAVKTFVSEWNPTLVREACLREIKRGGQVYFVHNVVETIDATAASLAELVPEATVRVAHGQMRERDLERAMLDFYHRRFNVLVCTTIIESGIDVPTANTIIINRADRFGLAQLHQLRGRVGRSHHRAYAYLIAPPRNVITPDAAKRLEAIESLEELGAGFVLATHDLEIRGAGELLGAEQSGQIHEIGFALYTELLTRAVDALKAGRIPDLDAPLHEGPQLELRVPALLPEDYMPDVHMRLVMYKRIASAHSLAALHELQVEMIDRFGLLPETGKTLFRLAELKLQAAPLGVRKITADDHAGRIVFAERTHVDPARLVTLVQGSPERYRLEGADTLRFKGPMEDVDARFSTVSELLTRLASSGD